MTGKAKAEEKPAEKPAEKRASREADADAPCPVCGLRRGNRCSHV